MSTSYRRLISGCLLLLVIFQCIESISLSTTPDAMTNNTKSNQEEDNNKIIDLDSQRPQDEHIKSQQLTSAASTGKNSKSDDTIKNSNDIHIDDESRYIVKYKDGISTPSNRANAHARKSENTILILRESNADVMILQSEKEIERLRNDDSVEYVEKGPS